MPPARVYTIGHSTRPLAELVALLKGHGVVELADVRTVPRSRHNPQFNTEALAAALPSQGVAYRHWPALGGLRKARADSPNAGWRNDSFRGYADYMQTPEFKGAVDAFAERARATPCALMCAEAVPWRCHRSLIGDALLVRGFEVIDLIGAGDGRPHKLTPFARVDGTNLTYPPDDLLRDANTR